MRYEWREIPTVPDAPGVYAWYYKPELTEFDVNRVIGTIHGLKSQGDTCGAEEAVRNFLDAHIFKCLTENPFEVVLRGPLKPSYRGEVVHNPTTSGGLIARVVEAPERLRVVKRVLEQSAPNFASPIYIGMSKKLRSRLSRHKALIEKYGDLQAGGRADTLDRAAATDDDSRDQSFAREIANRKIPPARLFVMIHVVDGSSDEYIDIENILNRIHFPLLGRN